MRTSSWWSFLRNLVKTGLPLHALHCGSAITNELMSSFFAEALESSAPVMSRNSIHEKGLSCFPISSLFPAEQERGWPTRNKPQNISSSCKFSLIFLTVFGSPRQVPYFPCCCCSFILPQSHFISAKPPDNEAMASVSIHKVTDILAPSTLILERITAGQLSAQPFSCVPLNWAQTLRMWD